MPATGTLAMFIAAALTLLLIPGPAVLYIFARSVEQGRVAGVVSILGIHVATGVHIIAAAVGLSAMVASSPIALEVVKYAGATYLIGIGIKKILSRAVSFDETVPIKPYPYGHLFRDGFAINLLNPKTVLFFLAFLPQFIDPSRGSVAAQTLILGMVYTILGIMTDGSYAMVAGGFGNWLKRNANYLTIERYVSGIILVGLGFMAAFFGSKSA
ncbi:Lysine exporter protein (LYSE/YGGA) (plasmid) [Rhizobium leguminosarum bv. trifolii WSM2304]|uniref:Lysine exporter protein (LYSE/YGGA) n=1 Tax=Rhizobium leguminosarum bv. trifolii (strain WSM2304) TaxID=395492 RepID=A0ABF7QXA5_RHILW|nr:LysE family translocator [Rhizobium leguminosarum]ACI58757.1 Lysine exporter protein (LYSE/YGGA) [Rhizobium leguminosarum bv. trifolii WSM2304]